MKKFISRKAIGFFFFTFIMILVIPYIDNIDLSIEAFVKQLIKGSPIAIIGATTATFILIKYTPEPSN